MLQEPLSAVILYTLASEVWNYLEKCYEGKGQYMMVQLLGDIFRYIFLNTVPVTNFIWPYLHQFFKNSHSLNGTQKPLKIPFDQYQSCLEAISIG